MIPKGNIKRISAGLLSMVMALPAFLQPVGVYAAKPEPAAYVAEYRNLKNAGTGSGADVAVPAENPTGAGRGAVLPDPGDIPEKSMTEAEMEAVMEGMEQAEGTRRDAKMIAEEEGVLLFAADSRMGRPSGPVTMVPGRDVYYPESLGNYSTCYFTVNGRIAYCLESAKGTPDAGSYAAFIIEGNPDLQKALYYGYGGAGDLTGSYMPSFDEDLKYVFTHIAASYFYCGMDGFAGCTMDDLRDCGVLGWINYLESLPAPPDPHISLSATSLKAACGGPGQVTGTTVLEGDPRNSITIRLPGNVTFHSTGGAEQTGGEVEVYGGTGFYFSAPVEATGKWDTGDMEGRIRTVWRALVVSTGGEKQDIGSYYEEEGGNSVRLSVDWLERARVRAIKVDSVSGTGLPGAVFGIYRDPACTDLAARMGATDSSGVSEAEIIMTQGTVYVREITAPTGYRINAAVYPVEPEAGGTVTVTVPDVEQLGNLTIYKEGESLTGADPAENGMAFRYGNRRQGGAVFNVYAAGDIATPYGRLIYRAGDLVAGGLVTGGGGSVTLRGLHMGKYRVAEARAPEKFYNRGETKDVEITYAGQMAETSFSGVTFQNDRQKARVLVEKRDRDTGNGLAGGIFGLYAAESITGADGNVIVPKGALLDKAETDREGEAIFPADIPIGFGYEVRELQAPEGYLRDAGNVYSFRFEYTGDREAAVTFSHTFTNERASATVRLQKKDRETGVNIPQGDATLEQALYGLYAGKDIIHPDKKTGVLYKAGDQVGALSVDKEGRAEITGLYLGEYVIKEISPPAGYLADPAEYTLVCSYEGDLVPVVERSAESPEQVKKQPFQIIKAAENGNTDAELLQGAGFTAWLESSLGKGENGGYDFDSAQPVILGENGMTEIFTDERGYARSIPLPYGTYIIRETTTPDNYKPARDFTVRITEHKPDTPQVWRVILDGEFKAKLKIVKRDAKTHRAVLSENTEFRVYDLDKGEYVEQVTTYPAVTTHQSYFTDSRGCLILPQNLGPGRYRIEEVSAPPGYTLNRDYCEVSVDSDTPCRMDDVSGDAIIEVPYEDQPVKGELHIVKKGEVLGGHDGRDFFYGEEPLEGAEFKVYAAEDIYTADFQKDGDGNRLLEYASGTLAGTLVTDRDGRASIGGLPPGTYRVVETKAPEGFVPDGSGQTVTFACAGQDTPVIEQTATFGNDRQKVEISAVKKDAKNGTPAGGAVFGLYAEEDILAHGEVAVKAGTLLGEAVSGEDGRASFALDLPFGEYYVKEQKAPAGYVSSNTAIGVSATYQGQDVGTASFAPEFGNEPTAVSIRKTDAVTGVGLSGAVLSVLDSDGNVLDTWKSVKGEGHIIERLAAGETYTLREELAPYGYLKAGDIMFTVEDTAEIQETEMQDDVPTGTIIINKKGEFLNGVSLPGRSSGLAARIFEYATGPLEGVVFEVYALEDIRAADGESGDYYKKDEPVGTIITDSAGTARLEGLPAGKYYVKEKKTAEGYVPDGEILEADLSWRGQDTEVITFSADWQNNRRKAEVHVTKTEQGSGCAVEGAVFALCAKEDITNAAGAVIMDADTVIEEKASDRNGKLKFTADLPAGFSYYVKETAPAPGFTSGGGRQDFAFTGEEAEKAVIPFAFSFENEPTVFEFTKTSLTDGKAVEGAKLKVTDEKGNTVDEWVSGREPHTIRKLAVGKCYTMTETEPAGGYVTAGSIAFTVENTGKVQKVEMKDDVTKVEISKTDTAGNALPGAGLSILDKEGNTVESWISESAPHYMEKLPVGEYTLHEDQAPEGYMTAEDMTFEVRDTGELQKVVMRDEAKPDEPAEIPETGDGSQPWLWLALAGIAACCTGAVLFLRRRK